MRIEIHQRGVTNLKAGLTSGEIGIHDFPDDPKHAGWLAGQVARGNLSVVGKGAKSEAEALDLAAANKTQHPDGVTEPKVPATAASVYAESALGPTSGSAPESGEPVQTYADGAEGLTIGSTAGDPLPVADEAKDLADANKTQHPEDLAAQRGKPKKGH